MVALGFRNFSVHHPTKGKKHLIQGVSGYVKRGCITAGDDLYFLMITIFYDIAKLVMGASASGKSVLLQALSGRIQDLQISGSMLIDGRCVDPKKIGNPISYVTQEDNLIGELTAREMTMNAVLLTRNGSIDALSAEVEVMLKKLGLSEVADKMIGTLIFVRTTLYYSCYLFLCFDSVV
jgi:ABC-type uncharacterized transport system ATPase component